ncbi:MAG: restriction endonuclease subunit S [Undibacterium sp.]|nr:restriction endonuclease subunit S [Opitutaceae bacterium]
MKSCWEHQKMANAPIRIIDGDRGTNYPKQSDFSDIGDCLFLNTGNVTEGGFDFSKCQFISKAKDEVLRKGKLDREDVIMTTRGTIGNVAYFNAAVPFESIRINSGMVIFRSDLRFILPSFLYQFFRSPQFNGQVNSLKTGAAQPQLPIRDIKCIDVPIPPLDQQRKIADTLSTYDDLIENNRRRIQLLEESARLLYKEWFVHLRFPGHEHVKLTAGVPQGWERKLIEQVCGTIGGGTPSTAIPSFWENGDVTWVVPTDVTRNDCLALLDSQTKITESGLRGSSAKMLPPNAILMTSRASVGFFALVDRPVCTNQGFISIVPHDDDARMFMLHNLLYRVEEIRGNASGSTFKEISKGRFRAMDIVMPTKTLLTQFNEFSDGILQQVRVLRKQNAKLTRARDLLLPRLMSGELVA